MQCPECSFENRPGARFCKQCGQELTPAPSPVSVHIEGGVSGQVAIGDHILQIGDVHGGVVNVMAPGEKIVPQSRPIPVDLRPRPFPDLLDRAPEIDAVTAAFESAQPVEFHAAAGLGKTALLRHLAHHPAAAAFPDGVVYLSARHQPAADLLQSLYDAFYEAPVPYKPTESQLRHDLQNKRALVLLDDVELAREDVERLMNAASASVFLLTSPERRLWGEGQSLLLGGLPPEDALALIERELGRPLTAQERPVAHRLRAHAKGSPLALIQIAAEAREKDLLLTDLQGQKQEGMRTTDLLEFPRQQMQLVRYITRQGEATLEEAAEHLGETPADAQQMLDALIEMGYLERAEKKGDWVYRMHFARKSARGLPPGIWNALEPEAAGAAALADALNALPAPERQVMAALAALGGAPVHADHLADLTGIADVATTLQALQRRGLAQAHSPRYTLTGGLDATLQQVWDLTPWRERALAHLTAWAEAQSSSDRLLEEADGIVQILAWAAGAGRWADVLRLGRAIQGALALGGRWATWAQMLRWTLQATQALGDQAAEAWALHQLGTRALCLGDGASARASLTQALQLREALGDRAGAAVTQHNLDLLSAVPPAPPREPPPSKPRPPLRRWLLPAVVIAALGGLVVIAGAALIIAGALPTPLSQPTRRPVGTTNPTPQSTEVPVEAPWISVALEQGCDREYARGDQARLLVESNVGGPVKVQLDDQPAFGMELEPGQVWETGWEFADVPPGEHALTAVLMSPEGERLDEASCFFAIASPCIDFEDLPVGAEYIEGDTFASSAVKIFVADGVIHVEDERRASGSGKEINMGNAYLEFYFGRPLDGLDLRYGQERTTTPFAELVINDDSWSGSLLDSADGEVIGGVAIAAGGGALRLDGRIDSFIIGGNGLYIDDVCTR